MGKSGASTPEVRAVSVTFCSGYNADRAIPGKKALPREINCLSFATVHVGFLLESQKSLSD